MFQKLWIEQENLVAYKKMSKPFDWINLANKIIIIAAVIIEIPNPSINNNINSPGVGNNNETECENFAGTTGDVGRRARK